MANLLFGDVTNKASAFCEANTFDRYFILQNDLVMLPHHKIAKLYSWDFMVTEAGEGIISYSFVRVVA